MTKVMEMTLLILMPMSWLVSKSLLTARMAMPILVWLMRYTRAKTRAMVSSRVRLTSWIASRMEVERSPRVTMRTEPGICACSRGNSAMMRSTVRTVLAPGWRLMSSSTELTPLTSLTFCTSSVLSRTWAMSARRMPWPSRVATITWAKTRASISSPGICTIIICRLLSSWPSAVLALAVFSALATSSRVRSSAASRAGSACTRTA